jgi:hypothetical protein
MKRLGLFLFAASLSFGQSAAPVQLMQVPPKPTCNPSNMFDGGTCRDSINAYNQVLQQRQQQEIQLFVARQEEWASPPLQPRIADQQSQIRKLQEQMQVDLTAAIQDQVAAHREGFIFGIDLGVSSTLAFLALIFGIRKLKQSISVIKKPQSDAASAYAEFR